MRRVLLTLLLVSVGLVEAVGACGSDENESNGTGGSAGTRVDSGPSGFTGGKGGGSGATGGASGGGGSGASGGGASGDAATVAECIAYSAGFVKGCDEGVDCLCGSCSTQLLSCVADEHCRYLAICAVTANCYDAACFLGLPASHPDVCGDLNSHTAGLAQVQEVGTCIQAAGCMVATCTPLDGGLPSDGSAEATAPDGG